jgi:hypothetical protein
MNIQKLKQNPKKIKKLKTQELLELFHLTNEELKIIVENEVDSPTYEKDVESWEKFLEEVSDMIDSRE